MHYDGDGLDRPLKVPEAAKYLGCSRAMVYELCYSGKLKYYHVGRHIRIKVRWLIDYQDGNDS
jgi:excisionase family DNA binding protein